VSIALTIDPAKYTGDALINWQIVRAMGLNVVDATPDWIANSAADLIVDAIFGTGLTRPPRPPFERIVAALDAKRVLSVDLPSGLDCDTGLPLGPCVRAERTVTFVAEKAGFANPLAREFTGEIIVGEIGCPRELIDAVLSAGSHCV
jgi:NAD(P)H-hydrate epimerase